MDALTALHRAILEQPAEDTPRLLYADALDERGGVGDAARAEFIRVQVEQARLGRCKRVRPASQTGPCPCPFCAGRRRERELWNASMGYLFDVRTGDGRVIESRLSWERGIEDEPGTCVASRGFVDRVHLSTTWFDRYAKEVFGAHPIGAVHLQDRVCDITDDSEARPLWCGRADDRHLDDHPYRLPWKVFMLLRGGEMVGPGDRIRECQPPEAWTYNRIYRSIAESSRAASDAAVAWGRIVAGLPALPG